MSVTSFHFFIRKKTLQNKQEFSVPEFKRSSSTVRGALYNPLLLSTTTVYSSIFGSQWLEQIVYFGATLFKGLELCKNKM